MVNFGIYFEGGAKRIAGGLDAVYKIMRGLEASVEIWSLSKT